MARLDLLNARVAARRSRLLGDRGLRALAVQGSLPARLAWLRTTAWAEGLPPGGPGGNAAGGPGGHTAGPAPGLDEVEAALRAAVRREADWLAGLAEGAAARRALDAFLSLRAADAVTALLRGVAGAAPLDRLLAAAPPAPGLPEPLLRRAAQAPTVAQAVEVLHAAGHPLGPPLRAALPAFPSQGLAPLEAAVEQAVIQAARDAARHAGRDGDLLLAHLGDRADARNAGLLLALAGAGSRAGGAGAHLLPGGPRLPRAQAARLLGAELEVVRAALAAAFPGAEAALAAPAAADLALERRLLRAARRSARREPLSLAVPLVYLLERQAEARRLCLLLRTTALELPADDVLSLLEA